MNPSPSSILRSVSFDEHGLVPAIIQDAKKGEVLMMAFMNRQALTRTLKTGLVHFYSRSRKKLWLKGETSGHVQRVKEIRLDCDGDAILIRADQAGGACHTGYRSCFYRRRTSRGRWKEEGRKIFDPKAVYKR